MEGELADARATCESLSGSLHQSQLAQRALEQQMVKDKKSFNAKLEQEVQLARSLARVTPTTRSDALERHQASEIPEVEDVEEAGVWNPWSMAPSIDLLTGHFEEGLEPTEKHESRWRGLSGVALQQMATENARLEAELQKATADCCLFESKVVDLTQEVGQLTEKMHLLAKEAQNEGKESERLCPQVQQTQRDLSLKQDRQIDEGTLPANASSPPAWVQYLPQLWLETDLQLEKLDKSVFKSHEAIWKTSEELHEIEGASPLNPPLIVTSAASAGELAHTLRNETAQLNEVIREVQTCMHAFQDYLVDCQEKYSKYAGTFS